MSGERLRNSAPWIAVGLGALLLALALLAGSAMLRDGAAREALPAVASRPWS